MSLQSFTIVELTNKIGKYNCHESIRVKQADDYQFNTKVFNLKMILKRNNTKEVEQVVQHLQSNPVHNFIFDLTMGETSFLDFFYKIERIIKDDTINEFCESNGLNKNDFISIIVHISKMTYVDNIRFSLNVSEEIIKTFSFIKSYIQKCNVAFDL